MIESVCRQSYANWELYLADASDEKHAYVREICQDFSIKDTRILYKRLNGNGGISANTNEAVKLASGDYLSLLDHDDEYTKNALFEIVKAINERSPDVLYIDEDKISTDGKRKSPFYKPDFSPDLLYSQIYGKQAFAEETKNLRVYSARFPLSEEKPLVSVIIPTKDHMDLLSDCIQSILEKTAYQNYEILILDNLSTQPETFDFFLKRYRKKSERTYYFSRYGI